MGIYNDAFDGLGDGDSTSMWVKPIDMLKISFGKFDSSDDGLRGDFTYGSWAWLRPFNWLYNGEGLTFSGVQNTGALVELDPIEGLHVAVNIPFTSKTYEKDLVTGEVAISEFEDTYRGAQVALGYNIDGIGTIKVQWIGKNSSSSSWGYKKKWDGVTDLAKMTTEQKYYGDVEAAFDLKAVENLYVTLGGRFSVMESNYHAEEWTTHYKLDSYGYNSVDTKRDWAWVTCAELAELAKVALGVSYNIMDGFTVFADGAVAFYNDIEILNTTIKEDPRFSFGIGISYAIPGVDGLSLDADFRYLSKAKYKYGGDVEDLDTVIGWIKDADDTASFPSDANASISFLIGLNKTVGSNGLIGIGFQGGNKIEGFSNEAIKARDDFIWAVPVKLQVSF
jgi:hypothetical protein